MLPKNIIFLVCLSLFTSVSFGANMKPEKCPSISAIQTAGHLWPIKDYDNKYAATRDNQNYDTNDIWEFIIWGIDASSLEEAGRRATEALSTLSLKESTPKPMLDLWKCTYDIGFGYTAAAYSPPLTSKQKKKLL